MAASRKIHSLIAHYPSSVPHCGAMGQELLSVEPGRIRLRQPYGAHLLGDAEAGLIHTSVQLTMVDSGFGAAVLSALEQAEAIATMDLRMDYHRAAVAGQDLYLDAQVDRMTRQVVFVSGTVWQGNPQQATALARAAFMRSANSTPPVTGKPHA